MKKTILLIMIIFFIFVISNIYYYDNKLKILTEDIYEQKSIQVKELFRNEVKRKFGGTFGLTYIFSKNQNLINALVSKDNSKLDYKKIIKELSNLGEYKNLWLQIIDKDGYSFYRSWTNKIGDHAASARIDIQDMLIEQKPKKGISTGRFDMTFKTMVPLFHKGKFIGIIELISKFNSIAKHFQSIGIEPLMVVHEDYTKRFIRPFSGIFIGNNYVANLDVSKDIMDKAKEFGLKKLMYSTKPIELDNYLIITDQIKNVHGGDMGFFIFFVDKKTLDKTIIYDFNNDYFIKLMVALFIFVLAILVAINRDYAKQLRIKVRKKTLKVRKQKSKLKSLLKIYDDNVIFSKTNTKGIITHASEAFCRISGYTKEELIGKPHNIVRHPDMPKDTFKAMWKTITSGKVWKGEVKNLKKDGTFYWVEAEIEPIYKGKNIVGYSAVRQDITALKEIDDVQKDIIFTMGSIGERRSEETGNHVKRVAEYSRLLALKYGLSESESEMLAQASPMHDIGKVAIPDSILKKPGALNAEETVIMRSHVKLGYEMLKNSNRPLLKTAAIVAHEHHEKWDGTGYPNGLKGENIHIYGRITAVADVFDALGSDRYYKKAWEDEKVFRLLKEESGKHFDPTLVKLFFENLDEFLEIRDKFVD